MHQRKHLLVLHAAAGAHPLQIAVSIAPARAHRVGVVDQPAQHHRQRLKAAVRVDGEAGDAVAVVHAVGLCPVEISAVAAHGLRVKRQGRE
jgi:hypothetical protein